jgi:hypothetical protein
MTAGVTGPPGGRCFSKIFFPAIGAKRPRNVVQTGA